MTVNPGWGGQPFIGSSPGKVQRLRGMLSDDVVLEVDGGIGPETVRAVARAGSGLWVAGSAVFGSDDPGAAVHEIVAAAT